MPGGRRPCRCRRPVLTGLLACILLQVCLPLARAADRLYYSSDANTIRWTNLDGPFASGGQVATGGATVNAPHGIAIDSATGRIYWANNGVDKISYAALDGSGGADLSITPTGAVSGPYGLGINPVSRRLYWANATGNSLASAALDGSGATVMPNIATHTNPTGLAVDPVFNRFYWANRSANRISRGSTSPTGGSGDSDISTGTATVNGPTGVALDTDQATAGASSPPGRIFWTNNLTTKVSYAALDGSAAGDLTASGAPVNAPRGVAVDPAAGLIYWANDPATGATNIAYAHLDGSGGGVAAPADHPQYIALLQTPRGRAT